MMCSVIKKNKNDFILDWQLKINAGCDAFPVSISDLLSIASRDYLYFKIFSSSFLYLLHYNEHLIERPVLTAFIVQVSYAKFYHSFKIPLVSSSEKIDNID